MTPQAEQNSPSPKVVAPPAKTDAEEVIQTSFRLLRTRWKRLQELCIDERMSVQSTIVGALEVEFAERSRIFRMP